MSFLLNVVVIFSLILFGMLDVYLSIKAINWLINTNNPTIFFIGVALISSIQIALLIEYSILVDKKTLEK